MTARPIFVIGTARSGTTWLANMLISHPQIAGVAASIHQGIHESHLFSHTRYVLRGAQTCRDFVDEYKKEDYFKLTGLDPEEFCAGKYGKLDIYQFFSLMMAAFASLTGASYWLEKTPKHAIYYSEILKHFPGALFVVIIRDFRSTLLSNLNKFARPGASRWRQVTEKVYRYVSDMRAIDRLKYAAPDRVVFVRYEELLRNKDSEMSRILDFLRLESIPLESAFPADSSFKIGVKKQYKFSKREWWIIECLKRGFFFLPYRFLFYLRQWKDRSEATFFPRFDLIQ